MKKFIVCSLLFLANISFAQTGATTSRQHPDKSSGAYSTPPVENALSFDGVDDYVNCGNGSTVQLNGTAVTLEAWIKADSWQKYVWQGGIVVNEGNTTGYMLRCGNNGDFDFAIGDGSSWHEVVTGPILTTGQWYHLAGVYDGSNMTIYVDGQPHASVAFNGNIAVTGYDLAIGTSGENLDRVFAGEIDEVRIWNIARSQTDIQNAMDNTLAGSESGLVAYYRFNEGSAGGNNAGVTTLSDRTANANDGTLTNFALTGDTSNWVTSYAMVRPGAASATNITTSSFTANWTAPSRGATPSKYYLTVAVDSDFSSLLDNNLDVGDTLSWDVTGNPGVKYYYRVCCSNDTVAGISQNSATTSVTQEALPIQLVSLTATTLATGVQIDWTTVSETNNLGFYVERNAPSTGAYATVSDLIPGAGTLLQQHHYQWTDTKVTNGNYNYRLRLVDLNGATAYSNAIAVTVSGVLGVGATKPLPTEFVLHQNYPNPFNPSTVIDYDLPEAAYVHLTVYDMLGREVATIVNGTQDAGYKSVEFSAANLPSGIYTYRLTAGTYVEVKKMLLLK